MIKTDIISTLYERNDENDKLFTCSCRSKCKRRKSVIKYDFYDSLLCCYFKKWCISTVDTVKEQSQQAGQPEKKGFFGFGKKKDSDETKATKE